MGASENDFLAKLTELIEENISNEKFGVSELAREIGMSRSNLLRKVNKLTNLSASKFISQVRLKNAMEMLKENSFTVSEVSYKVGFNSTSYFIKCFHEYFGYPPGEVGKRGNLDSADMQIAPSSKRINPLFPGLIMVLVIIVVGAVFFKFNPLKQKNQIESIAVLPFINDSADSTNVYIINGLMEAILTDLQKIGNLRVISRTSVEKYRHSHKSIAEIAKELNVKYFVEGSGQKMGDKILLHIQLIEASTDNHLWAQQYNREAKDIFILQKEVAKNIVSGIKIILTPEEEDRFNDNATDNLVAYDYFLQGREYFNKIKPEYMDEAISFFEKAIKADDQFALAYANISIAYYMKDRFQVEKKYSELINFYADKALLFDSELAQALIAKALYFMYDNRNEFAIPYLEKALEYNPNSALVINILSEFYTNYIPDTKKYLEYALKGIQLDIGSNDSATASYIYLHVSNALIQCGFIEEAEKFINRSISYNPENLYSEYVKAFILYSINVDLNQLNSSLLETFNKDSTRLDVMQEVAKSYYYMRDYEGAYAYYKRFMDIREEHNLDIYVYENAKIGLVMSEMGMMEESDKLFQSYKDYADNNESIYKDLNLAVYYAFHSQIDLALNHLKLFSEQDNFHYWTILFLKIDPLLDNILDHPRYKKIIHDIENKFWDNHKKINATLVKNELLADSNQKE